MAFNHELAERQLIEIYTKALERLSNKLVNAKTASSVAVMERQLIAEIRKEMIVLDKNMLAYTNQVLLKTYNLISDEVKQYMINRNITNFSALDKKGLEIIANNLYKNFNNGINFVGRHLIDQVRTAVLEASAEKVATGAASKIFKESLADNLKNNGMMFVKYENGTQMSLQAYSNMAIRTATTEVVNVATTDIVRSTGRNLIQITQHFSPCPICAPYEGRVYSLDEGDPDYPYIGNVAGFGNGYQTIHPNCRHRLVPYIEEFDKDAEKTKKDSNKPFKDERTQTQKDFYNNRQKQNQISNEQKKLKTEKILLKQKEDKTSKEKRRLETINNREKVLWERKKDSKKWEMDTINEVATKG